MTYLQKHPRCQRHPGRLLFLVGGHVPTELVPRCPKCGGPMDIHRGAGQRMIPDTAAQARFQNFLKNYHGKKLVVLELGIGWRNQLIKAPMMRLVASEPNATYVTINLGEIYIADNIKEKMCIRDRVAIGWP